MHHNSTTSSHARKNRVKIYESRLHLFFTFLVISTPFLFLLLFAHFARISRQELFFDLGASAARLFVAYIIAVVLAWLLAILFYQGRRSLIALPLFDVLQSFPTFAVLPLITYFFRASEAIVVVFLILTVLWPILFSIISSLKLIKHDWEEAVDMAGLRGWNYIKVFLLPVSVPGLITGSIIGLGEGWEALIATEIIVGTQTGLGEFLRAFSTNPTITALGILGLLLVIFSLNHLVWLPLLDWGHRKMEE